MQCLASGKLIRHPLEIAATRILRSVSDTPCFWCGLYWISGGDGHWYAIRGMSNVEGKCLAFLCDGSLLYFVVFVIFYTLFIFFFFARGELFI